MTFKKAVRMVCEEMTNAKHPCGSTKNRFTINLYLKRMPFTGADIYCTQNVEAKQLILIPLNVMFVDGFLVVDNNQFILNKIEFH